MSQSLRRELLLAAVRGARCSAAAGAPGTHLPPPPPCRALRDAARPASWHSATGPLERWSLLLQCDPKPLQRACAFSSSASALAVRRRPPAPKAPPPAAPPERRINHRITAEEVRLVEEAGNTIVPRAEALRRARALGLDLVEVGAPSSAVPVCKILDYRQMLNEQQRINEERAAAQQEAQATKESIKTKGLRMGNNIAQHDLQTKLKKLEELLDKGFQVMLSVTYEIRKHKWKVEYPRAVEVAKMVCEKLSPTTVCWFDYSESGNKQVCIVFTRARGASKPTTPFPWEPGSKPPPFVLQIQQEEAERIKTVKHSRKH